MSNNHFVVGLGGTGGKVIRELKKLLKSNHSAQVPGNSEAHFEFAYLDTSDGLLHETDKWSVLGQDVSLARPQQAIFAAGSVRPILQDPQAFPGMRDWIEPRQVFDFIDAGTAGAAQKRKLGRLVFAQNARGIVELFQDRLRELEKKGGSARATIHVLCGLAGGTGSGFVVDTVAQLRALRPEADDYRILVYALLPDAGSKWAKDVGGYSTYYANGYAALAELNAMGARTYHPINVLNGQRLHSDKYFNGCYLVNNVNENKTPFQVHDEVPLVMAEFLFQKTLNRQWDGLTRAEKGENDTNFIEKDDGAAARAKLFMTFGIKRVVVPEQEIKEYMAYSFAEQAARQLMFNNFRQGEGYANEAVEKDWGAEARKPDVLERLQLSDAHLTLDVGILEDDSKVGWKPVREYWNQIGTQLDEVIKGDKTLKEADWIATLNNRMAAVFDETFRRLGGVRKFYSVKDQARLEMARHVARTIEKDFFQRWSAGELSLLQLRQFTDALLTNLAQRKREFEDKVQGAAAVQERLNAEIQTLTKSFNEVGLFGRVLTDRRDTRFSEIREQYQSLYASRTIKEGHAFAVRLMPLVVDQLATLRGYIDRLHQQLEKATTQLGAERNGRLHHGADTELQSRIFDRDAIDKLIKTMVVDEQGQLARTQQVRKAIVALAGDGVDSFEKMAQRVPEGALLQKLAEESSSITEEAHAELAKALSPVLNVNIVERLGREYAHNVTELRNFVKGLYKEAGSMVRFNEAEVRRSIEGNEGSSRGREQTLCVFVPKCDSNKDFHEQIRRTFSDEKDPGVDMDVLDGVLTNEIVVMKVTSLMPARFVESLGYLKTHYDALLRNADEAVLLHGEGNGSKLPPLFAPTGVEIQSRRQRQPLLLLARLLGTITERSNPETGLGEWMLKYKVDGRMRIQVLAGGAQWSQVLSSEQPAEAQKAIETAVQATLQEEYRHVDRKKELHQKYNDLVNARLEAANYNEKDAEYMALDAMGDTLKQLIGLPS